jgi:hypothetical protein
VEQFRQAQDLRRLKLENTRLRRAVVALQRRAQAKETANA